MTRALNDKVFNGFEREILDLTYVTLTQYDNTLENVHVAYYPTDFNNTLGKYVADHGIKQLRIAETEKYAHVTFFFNGGKEEPFEGEDRILIQSPKVATYDLQPEMSSTELTDKLVAAIESTKYDVIICNYPNGDMAVSYTHLTLPTKRIV